MNKLINLRRFNYFYSFSNKKLTLIKLNVFYSPSKEKTFFKHEKKIVWPASSKIMREEPIKNYKNINFNKIISKKESFFQYLFVQSIIKSTKIKLTNKQNFFITEFNEKYKQNQINSKTNVSSNETKINLISNKVNLSAYLDNLTKTKNLHLRDYSKINYNFLKESFLLQKKIFINYKKPFLSYWLLPFLGLIGMVPTLSISTPQSALIEDMAGPAMEANLNIKVNNVNNNSQVYLKNQINKDSFLVLTNKDISNNFYFPIKKEKNHIELESSFENQFLKYKEIMDKLFLSNLKINKKENQIKTLESNFDFSKFSLAILNKKLKQSCNNCTNFNWYWSNLNPYLNKNLISSKNFLIQSDFDNKIGIVFPTKLFHIGTSKKFVVDLKTDKKTSFEKKIHYPMSLKNSMSLVKSNTNSIKNFNFISYLPQSDFMTSHSPEYFIGVINDKTFLKKDLKNKILGSQANLINSKTSVTPYKSIKKALLLMDEIMFNGPSFMVGNDDESTMEVRDSLIVKNNNSNILKLTPILSFIMNDLKVGPTCMMGNDNSAALSTPIMQGLTMDDIENNFLNINSFNAENYKNNEFLEKIIHIIFKNKKNQFFSKEILTNKPITNVMQRYKSNPIVENSKDPKNIFFRKDVLYNSIFEGLKGSLNTILNNKCVENEIYISDNNNKDKLVPRSSNFQLIHNIQRPGMEAMKVMESPIFRDNSNELKKIMHSSPMVGLFNIRQQFSSEINFFIKNKTKNINFRSFHLNSTNQNSFKSFNILKLNHPIRGGSRIFQTKQFQPYKNISTKNSKDFFVFQFGVPAWSVPTMQVPACIIKDNAARPFGTPSNIMQVPGSVIETDLHVGSNIGTIENHISKPVLPFLKDYFNLEKNSHNFNNQGVAVESSLNKDPIIFKNSMHKKISSISIKKISEFNLQNFTNKNYFLFLNKYINLLSMNIKKNLTPYKLRLTYFPELTINLKSSSKVLNPFMKKEKVPSQTEKIFLSYLSKVKKPYKSNSDFSQVISKNRVNKKMEALLKEKNPLDVCMLDTKHYRTNYFNFKNLKLKTKVFLKKNRYTSKVFKYKINLIKKRTIGSIRMTLPIIKSSESFLRESKNQPKTISETTLNTANSRIFLSKQINFLKFNKLAIDQADMVHTDHTGISRPIIEKHALNIYKNTHQTKKNQKNKVTLSKKFIDILSKKQTLKIKRRLKKMKKETRRRKKRKIFYPRPKWITFSLYRNFLNNRYKFDSQNLNYINFPNSLSIIGNSLEHTNPFSSQTMQPVPKGLYVFNKVERLCRQSPGAIKNSSWKPIIRSLKKQVKLNEGQTKDFYRTSSTVFFDLKRILMKSNWLRNYLNPYFEKVKNIYQDLQTSSKKMEIYLRIRNFLFSFYVFEKTIPNLSLTRHQIKSEYATSIPVSLEPTMQPGHRGPIFDNDYQNFLFLNFNKKITNNSISTIQSSQNNPNISSNIFSSKIQNNFNIIEYNRIIYQRFQRIILSIKDNLNLNGEIKNRSKKLGKNIRSFIKRDYKSNGLSPNQPVNTNQKSSFWSKFIKNTILKINTYTSYGYNGVSHNNTILNIPKNNLFWALNKTNISASGTTENFYNFPKKLWENYKIREVSKSNKTKKIIYNLFNKYGLNDLGGSNRSKSLEGFNHILEQRYKNNIQNINSISQTQLSSSRIASTQLFLSPIETGRLLSEQNQVNGEDISPLISLNNYIIKSEQKLTNIENKLKLLGLYSKKIEKTYKNSYFRSLKQQLVNPSYSYYTKKVEMPHTSIEKTFKLSNEKNNINSFSTLNNYHKISNNYLYWWVPEGTPLRINYLSNILPIFKNDEISNFLPSKEKSNKDPITRGNSFIKVELLSSEIIFSLLFHFCTLVSFISLGGIRTLIKFYYILISKTSKLMTQISFIELFRPSIFLNNFNENNKYYKNEFSFQVKNNLENKFSKIISPSNLNNSDPIQLRMLFLQYITARNQITKLKKPENKLNIKNFLKITEVNLNKGWTTSKIKKSKFLESTWIVDTTMIGTEYQDPFSQNRNDEKQKKVLKQTSQTALVLNKYKFNLFSLFLFKTSTIFYTFYKIKFYIYFFLLKSIDLFALPISFIYKFFEKPGEYVVENLAYNFLVEWSSDLITTIPDTFDMNSYSYFSKFNRNITPLLLLYSTFGFTFSTFLNGHKKIYFDPFLWTVPLAISNSIIKRLLNSTLLIFIQQLYEPDIDSITREKKGIIFWDLWGEYLKQIAEENSINIYELTTDKEEQIKLLSKYDEILSQNIKTNFPFQSNSLFGITSNSKYPIDYEDKNSSFNEPSVYKSNLLKPSNSKKKLQDTTSYIIASDHTATLSKKIKSLKDLGNYLNFSDQIKKKEISLIEMNRVSSSLITENSFIDIATSNGSGMVGTNHIGARNFKTYNHNNTNFGWAASQFLSYQGKDTDLFIDLHPPKSFWSIPSIKYAYSIQQPIGSIVCQIFSGIFYKQVSKNILVVGSSNLEKSILIQAMAGETELKMITDNANRYAMVYRGVAVGIKLLRDVFEALSVHTPCIFLMEDIHIIGERRPFLIDEASSSDDAAYNKNQSMQGILLKEKSSGADGSREVLYRSTKHLLSHYKKPYKEPKNLATNHFSFTFLFSNISSRKGMKTRNNFFKPGGAALPIQVIKKENESKYKITNLNTKTNNQNNYFFGSLDPFHIFLEEKTLNGDSLNEIFGSDGTHKKIKYSSALELKTDKSQSLSPPSSSPFNVLILKEEKKLKHKKLIKEIPWFGLPGEQFSLISKYNYSTRIKIALLADLVLSNLSVKLDMITDLLVIIDSVKGNRGFVVFATTHIPSILDPALRRPGRFDETINLPLISTLFSRWSNYRYNIKFLSAYLYNKADYCLNAPLASTFSKGVTIDLFKSNLIIYDKNILNQSTNELINYINKKNSTFNKKLELKTDLFVSCIIKDNAGRSSKIKNKSNSVENHQEGVLSSDMVGKDHADKIEDNFQKIKKFKNINTKKIIGNYNFLGKDPNISSKQTFEKIYDQNQLISNKQFLRLKARNYSFACKSLISLLLFSSNSSLKWISILKDANIFIEDYSLYLTMFGNPLILKIVLMSMIGGKIGESFVLHSLKRDNISCIIKDNAAAWSLPTMQAVRSLNSKQSVIQDKSQSVDSNNSNIELISPINTIYKIENEFLFDFDNTWRQASSLLLSYLQKRQCTILTKNITLCGYSKGINKLLSFNNKYSLMEPPSPPITNILLPAKRYENYKKTFNNQYETNIANKQNSFSGSLLEKLQFHQQQRLLRRLYKYPIKEFFKSEILTNSKELFEQTQLNHSSENKNLKYSTFNSSYLTLAPLEKINSSKHLINLSKISSTNWCYKNILYNRHRTYLTNQWWNGQQGEHNAETTFLSDIDWRYTFVQSIGDINIDFPDAEQFYNPRNRRWFIDRNSDKDKWTYWFNIQSDFKDIYSHYISECFTKVFKFLNENREIIDFYAEMLHQVPSTPNSSTETGLNERELLNIFKRFYGTNSF